MKLKLFGALLPLLVLCLVGCASQHRFGVQAQGDDEHMFVSGDGQKEWYSVLELQRIASLRCQQKPDFKFEGTEMNIWVNTDGRKVLADVWFLADIGKPSLHVEIGRDGKVRKHKIEVLYG